MKEEAGALKEEAGALKEEAGALKEAGALEPTDCEEEEDGCM